MPYQKSESGNTVTLTCDGQTLAAAYIDAAHGLFDVLADGSKIRGDVRQEIVIQAADAHTLLAEWLKELLSRVAQTGMVYSDFEIFSIQKVGTQHVLTGAIYGETADSSRHTLAQNVSLQEKSVTCDEKAGSALCTFSLSRS